MKAKSASARKRKKIKRQAGFVTLLLVLAALGLGLLLSGSAIKKKDYGKSGTPQDVAVIPLDEDQDRQNLQLKTLKFTTAVPTPVTTVCAFDSTKTENCTCPDTMKWGGEVPGKYYYTSTPEQECKWVSPGRVNEECTLLKFCEQNAGPCSWSAPTIGQYRDIYCAVPKSITGDFVGDRPPPGVTEQLSVSCGTWKLKLDSGGQTWCVGKPVIYLYPPTATSVDVELFIPGEIYISIPKYPEGGWKNVLAHPDGTLIYNNEKYSELYYETKVKIRDIPTSGLIIPTSDLKNRLITITGKLGLNASEQADFMEYWMPLLKELKKPYIVFSLLAESEKERIDGVKMNPQPDVFINFIAYFKGVDMPIAIEPLVFPSVPERHGFTAVEWGGTIDPDSLK